MHRVLSLSSRTLLGFAISGFGIFGCGATHADAHKPPSRHASSTPPRASSALWVADQYFVSAAFPDEPAHVTGEFAQRFADRPTLGSLLAPRVQVAIRPLVERDDSAIVAATVTDPARHRVSEWYSYLARERGTWKMYALRTVEFSSAYRAMLDSLPTGRQMVNPAGAQRASVILATGSDSALRAFVASHEAPLDSLVVAYRSTPNAPAMIDIGDAESAPTSGVRRLFAATSASTVFRNPANPECTFIRMGGEGRRQVGAFRADVGCRIPPMNPAGLVYTEHVTGPWYVYRAL